MSLTQDLDFIAAQARQHLDDNEAFGYYVELDERSDTELDALVNAIAAPIIEQIDCQQCGNCCRRLDVYLEPSDIPRLANHLQETSEAVQATYVNFEAAQAVDEWGMFRHCPCLFLDDKRCRIYAGRPQTCRDYPAFTPDFRWAISEILGGYGLCPIIYHVIEHLKENLNWS